MKKISIIIGIIFSAIFIVGLVFHFRLELMEDPSITKPPIVDHFACSDYCPEDMDEYMVKIYEGVSDKNECRKLGGSPTSYTGWGTTYICIAEKSNLHRLTRYIGLRYFTAPKSR
jgi:hypothetical protein